MKLLATVFCVLCAISLAFAVNQAVCSQPQVIGPCRVRVPSFYYNAATGKCEYFDYGGCDGNQNRFRTQAECELTCL